MMAKIIDQLGIVLRPFYLADLRRMDRTRKASTSFHQFRSLERFDWSD